MGLLSLADGRLIAEEMGAISDGDRVVYLHGWDRDRTDWTKVASKVGGLAVDLPGFGSSARPTEAMGAHEHAELIGELIDGWGDGSPVTIVGHSFGGRIGIAAAVDFPERVKSLLIAGTPLFRADPGRQAIGLRLVKLANKIGLLSDARLEKERLKRGSADYRNAQGVMRESFVKLVNEDYRRELTQLTQPTSLVWGINDTAAKVSNAREAATILRDATLTEWEDTGHDVHLARPDEFADEIRKLLNR